MQIYSLYFDTAVMKMNAEVIKLKAKNNYELANEINTILESDAYDFFDYSEDIAILVDDQGLFKEGLPVFEIKSEFGDTNRLAGKLLFVRNVENEYSTDIGSIKYEDIFKLRTQLVIKFIGFTRGVS